MIIAEQIYAIVKGLPEEQANEVLSFAEFILAKHLMTHQSAQTLDNTVAWKELVDSLAGAWEDDFPSLEEIRTASGY
uniref:DUF2281 domain-containing protein n=1 Tax=Nostoc sp. CMAA1605 TaxID=2055159 RepID=UPI001F491EC0